MNATQYEKSKLNTKIKTALFRERMILQKKHEKMFMCDKKMFSILFLLPYYLIHSNFINEILTQKSVEEMFVHQKQNDEKANRGLDSHTTKKMNISKFKMIQRTK